MHAMIVCAKALWSTTIVIAMCFVLAAYAPLGMVAQAQSAVDTAKLQDLKQKAAQEIDRRIANLEDTLKKLDVTVQTTGTTTPSQQTSFPVDLKNKARQYAKTLVDELSALKSKTQAAQSLTAVSTIASSVDAQYGLGQITQLQATASQSIQSFAGVYQNLKTVMSDLQSQLARLKGCSADPTSANCGSINSNTIGDVSGIESQLDMISTMMTSVSSTVASSIALLNALVSSYNDLTRSLGGSSDGVTNLSTLSDLTNTSQLTNSTATIAGLNESYTAISSQIDTVNATVANIQALLTTVKDSVNQRGL